MVEVNLPITSRKREGKNNNKNERKSFAKPVRLVELSSSRSGSLSPEDHHDPFSQLAPTAVN